MACICFDYCTGVAGCAGSGLNLSFAACEIACREAGMGPVSNSTFYTNQAGQREEATCAQVLSGVFIARETVSGGLTTRHWYYHPLGPVYRWIRVRNIDGATLDNFTPLLFSAAGPSEYYTTDTLRHLLLGQGFLPPPPGESDIRDPAFPDPAPSNYFGLRCCAGREGVSAFMYPPLAYSRGMSCYDGAFVSTTPCNRVPCCRRGDVDWPPYPVPPSGGSAISGNCGLYDSTISGGDAGSCADAGFLPNTPGFISPFKFARSCYFPHACDADRNDVCGGRFGDDRACYDFCAGVGYKGGDSGVYSRSVEVTPRSTVGAQIKAEIGYGENGDAKVYSCNVGLIGQALVKTKMNLRVNPKGDHVFIGRVRR